MPFYFDKKSDCIMLLLFRKEDNIMNNIIILAAGLGKRMKTDMPKCSLKLLYKPMIEYIVDEALKVENSRVICVIGYKGEIIKDILKDKVIYAYQDKQLGTANAVLCGLTKAIGDLTIIIPGDAALIDKEAIEELIRLHKINHNTLSFYSASVADAKGYGRVINDNGIQIKEDRLLTSLEKDIKEINTGIYCVDTLILTKEIINIKYNSIINEYLFTDIVAILSKNYQVNYYEIGIDKVKGVNDLKTLVEVERMIQTKINDDLLARGIRLINPSSILISKSSIIDDSVTVYPNTIIIDSKVGKGTSVGANTIIDSSIIGAYCNIIASNISNSKIADLCMVGPFCHIKNNSEIGSSSRLGNYVEIKNSTIGKKSSVAHLAYIGDSIIGDNVNFGCGSITVNYNGEVKNKTIIGSNSFIGCNSNLIAPVQIKENAYIAAGSTITDDVEEGDFAIARAKQINKKDYAKKYRYKRK